MTKWTQEQLSAITTAPNLLVSAAAGSGKTAVLVERITRKLIPDENGNYTPIDKLLVVTFARDAANEMKERIKNSLYDAYANEKDKAKKRVLKEQIKGLSFSDIATIDSFCMNFVKQNFHFLGIDPKFKIFDPSEAYVYKNECMEEYFDKLYESRDENFLLLTSIYSKGYDDREVKALISSVYEFTRSLPDPDTWLRNHCEDYASFSNGIYCRMVEENFNCVAREALSGIKKTANDYAREIGSEDDSVLTEFGAVDLWSVFKNDISALSRDNFEWDDIWGISRSFPTLKKTSSKKPEAMLQKRYMDYREGALAAVRKLLSFVKEPSHSMDGRYREKLYPCACAISKITSGFAEYVFEKKSKSGKYEFNDLEHMTAELLRNDESIRISLVEKYEEILMDEYQDTNALQEDIFSLISDGKNRFMVGDMKQSIYRFRSSDPLIFRNKDELYAKNPKEGNRVVLSKNFRSRRDVLEGINSLFMRIMTYDVGEVDYNDDQALHYGNTAFDTSAPGNSYISELYVIEGAGRDSDDEDILSDEQTEAAFVAKKIRTMIDSRWQVLDKGKLRDVCESDFVILMNAVKVNSGVYIDALRACGLNGYSENKDFFEKTEIRLITSFVKAVNNPMRDIPLVSVMRSPVYRFTDDELAQIRLCLRGEFWKCVFAKSEYDDYLGQKCKSFVEDINRWRRMNKYMSADRLIWRLMTDCSLYDMCGILYGGETALANLRLYMERARMLSEGEIATLYDFEEYMDRLESSDGLGCAAISGTGIPIMTIHKSKGLEFPIVFVCGTGKRFVSDGYMGAVNLHKDLGFGLNDVNAAESYMIPTVNRKIIALKKNKESMSEQLRKLYVALTRAKEKLIVTGVVPGGREKNSAFDFADKEVSEQQVQSAVSFMHMMAPAIKQFGGEFWLYNEIQGEAVVPCECQRTVSDKKDDYDIQMVKKEIYELFERYTNIKQPAAITTKISVSELKSKSGFSSKLQRLPQFMKSGEKGGAVFGTTVHSVMESIVIRENMSENYISDEVKRILGEENNTVAEMVRLFFESDLGKRMVAGEIHREKAFELKIPALDSSGAAVEGETMLLQGVIDLYFTEGERLVLVDYKTDKCDDISELTKKYHVQLKWYRYAMEKLLRRDVDEVYIYSFHKNAYTEISEMIDK